MGGKGCHHTVRSCDHRVQIKMLLRWSFQELGPFFFFLNHSGVKSISYEKKKLHLSSPSVSGSLPLVNDSISFSFDKLESHL